MPFPDVAQDIRSSPREINVDFRRQTNDSGRLQVENVPNNSFSGAVSNEKRARAAIPDLGQVPYISLRNVSPEVSNQFFHQPARVQDDGTSNRVHAASQHVEPRKTTQSTGLDEDQVNHLPLQHSNGPEERIVETDLIPEHTSPPDELSGSRSPHCIDGEASHHKGEDCKNEDIEQPLDMVGNQDRADPETASIAKRQIDDNIPDDQGSIHEVSRVPSRAQSESRPDSRRSNQGRALRPFNDADFSHRLPTTGRHHAASAKVLKSSATQNSLSTANTPKGKKYTLASYKEFLRKGESYQEVFLHCEEQQALIDAQKSEIVDMQKSDASCQQQIKALEAEKATLTQNMKKFADMSSKYKTHMNEVVKAQKYLTSQAARIQKESSEILQARTIFDKIKKAIEEAKDLRVSAQNFHEGMDISGFTLVSSNINQCQAGSKNSNVPINSFQSVRDPVHCSTTWLTERDGDRKREAWNREEESAARQFEAQERP